MPRATALLPFSRLSEGGSLFPGKEDVKKWLPQNSHQGSDVDKEKTNFFHTVQVMVSTLGPAFTVLFLSLMSPKSDLRERTDTAKRKMAHAPGARFNLPRQKQVFTPRKIIR